MDSIKIQYLCIVLVIILNTFVSPEENESTGKKCSFFCFLQAFQPEKIQIEPYLNLSCTHFVYGFATVDSRFALESPSSYDFPESSGRYGNYEMVKYLKANKPHIKTLLGISANNLNFIEMNHSRSLVAADMVQTARKYGFDGIFLKVDGEQMFTLLMQNFMETLMDKVVSAKIDSKESERLQIVFGFQSRRATIGKLGLAKLQPFVDYFYMFADDVSSTTAKITVPVDALNPSENVEIENSLSDNAEKLVKNGLRREKIIIGLSAWSHSYGISTNKSIYCVNAPSHLVTGPGRQGNRTQKLDGKLAYDEVCPLINVSRLIQDEESATISFVNNKTWYSLNMPHHPSFLAKVEWVSQNGFGGIGVMSLYADDKNGSCGQGSFPVHRYVGENFKCRSPEQKKKYQMCPRMCDFDVNSDFSFNFTNFQASWCTHIVMSSLSVEESGVVDTKLKLAIDAFTAWKTDEKPLLLFTLGATDNNSRWRNALMDVPTRHIVVDNINNFLNKYNIDGINVAWTLEALENDRDFEFLQLFLQELRLTFKNTQRLLVVTVTAETTLLSRYNVKLINELADYVIVEGYRFHSVKSIFTGHHSPLFQRSTLLNDPKMTIEGIAYDWVNRGGAKDKIILSFTTEGIVFSLKNIEGNVLGAQSNPHISHRIYNDRKVSQSEICEIKANNDTKLHYISDLAVPYLVNGNDFVAYDDQKSIQIKSIWTSTNQFEGIALMHVEKDNVEGKCPQNKPFNLLQTIAKTQVCPSCKSGLSQSKAEPLSNCRPKFRVNCVYRIPQSASQLNIKTAPFKLCTEMIMEETVIDENGQIPPQSPEEEVLRYRFKHEAEVQNEISVIPSIRCNMTGEKFDQLMATGESRMEIKNNVYQYLKKYDYRGFELNCNALITNKNKGHFDDFLVKLIRGFPFGKCFPLVSTRIPADIVKLDELYDIETLNTLSYVRLDPFVTSTGTRQLLSPLYSSSGQNQQSIDSVVSAWISSGLERSAIVVTIPSYAIIQKPSNQTKAAAANHTTQQDSFKIVSRMELCSKLHENGINKTTDYETVSAYATSINKEWMSFETQETADYKTRFCIRQKLGGVTVDNVNDDDYMNICGDGVFPITAAVGRNNCNP